jgi:hypothetical protein
MKKIKIIVFLILLVLGTQKVDAQVYRFEATGFSVMEKTPKGSWGKWSEFQPLNIMITLDTSKNRIVVYSKEVQLYEIQNYEQKQENEEDLIYPFSCTDIDGQPFKISFITRKKQGNRKQLYINQNEVILVYNIINFSENK